jgi:hypothetical protein
MRRTLRVGGVEERRCLILLSPSFLSSSVERELTSGEQLLWKGRPRTGIRLRPADAYLVPFSLLWGGFAVFWEFMALDKIPKNNAVGWAFPLFGIPFVLLGLHFMFGRFLVDAKMRANTEYALTDRRAIIVSGLFSRNVKSINLQSVPEIGLTETADRSGTISFGPAQPFGMAAQQAPWFFGTSSQPAFEMIENVRNVYELMTSRKPR